jgi:hypothetical protein
LNFGGFHECQKRRAEFELQEFEEISFVQPFLVSSLEEEIELAADVIDFDDYEDATA